MSVTSLLYIHLHLYASTDKVSRCTTPHSSSGRKLFGVFGEFRLQSRLTNSQFCLSLVVSVHRLTLCRIAWISSLLPGSHRVKVRATESCLQVKPVERVPYRFGPNPIVSKTFPPREKRRTKHLSNMTREP